MGLFSLDTCHKWGRQTNERPAGFSTKQAQELERVHRNLIHKVGLEASGPDGSHEIVCGRVYGEKHIAPLQRRMRPTFVLV